MAGDGSGHEMLENAVPACIVVDGLCSCKTYYSKLVIENMFQWFKYVTSEIIILLKI